MLSPDWLSIIAIIHGIFSFYSLLAISESLQAFRNQCRRHIYLVTSVLFFVLELELGFGSLHKISPSCNQWIKG